MSDYGTTKQEQQSVWKVLTPEKRGQLHERGNGEGSGTL